MATKKLYKATLTTTVYFMSDQTDEMERMRDAERSMVKDIRANGLREFPEPVLVTGRERPAGTWEPGDYVHGSEKMKGGKQLTLIEAMEMEENQQTARMTISAMGL